MKPKARPTAGDGGSWTTISAERANSTLAGLVELGGHLDLVYILVRRDISVRFKQALFGFGWAVLQPVVLVVVFSLFLHQDTGRSGVAYPVFAMAGLVPWTFFQSAAGAGGTSLVDNERLISKVYFPRLAIPLAAVLAWMPDLALSLVILGIMMVAYGVAPGVAILALPAFLLLAVVAAAGVAVWASALNVAYRDVKYAIPFLLQLWLFATPGIYSARRFSGAARVLVAANPATGFVEGMRYALVGVAPASWLAVSLSGVTAVALLASGLAYFARVERYFADVI